MIDLLKEALSNSNFDDAAAILKTNTDESLVSSGLANLWILFRDSDFISGELRIAPLLLRECVDKPAEYLLAVKTYAKAGLMRDACLSLSSALKFPNFLEQIETIIDLSTETEQNDLCEEVLKMILYGEQFTLDRKVQLGVKFARQSNRYNARHLSVKCLRTLREISKDSSERLGVIVLALQEIGEMSMALDIREMLVEREPNNAMRRIELIELKSRIDISGLNEALEDLLITTPDNSIKFWELVALSYQRTGEFEKAIGVRNRVIELGGDELKTRIYIATLYIKQRKISRAVTEMKKILKIENIDAYSLQNLAKLALQINEKNLMRIFFERQFDEAGFTEEGLKSKKRSREEWLMLAGEAKKFCRDDLEIRMIEFGLNFYPNDKNLAAQKKEFISRQRFLGGAVKANPPPSTKRKSGSVSTFLAKLFSE